MQDQVLVGKYNCYNLKFYKELKSTNLEASLLTSMPYRTVVCAETQTEGRGKGNRKWISPFGDLYMSLVLNYKKDLKDLLQLSFVFSLAIGSVLQNVTELDVGYKWPNDILIRNKKIAGILVESYSHHYGTSVIIGAGLNILNYPIEVNFPAISLAEFINIYNIPSRFSLLKQIVLQFDILEFEWHMFGFLGIKNMWMCRAFMLNKEVCVVTNSALYKGIFSDIDENGNMILILPNNSTKSINYGDILKN